MTFENNASLEELIAEVDRPLWRNAAYARLDEFKELFGAEQRERKRLLGWLSWMDKNGVHTQTAFLKAMNGAPVPE